MTPAAALREWRYTSCSLAPNASYIASQEIRADRQPSDQIRTGFTASGSVGFELSYDAEFATRMVGVMMCDGSGASTVTTYTAATISFVAATNIVNSSVAGFLQTAGSWIEITGSVSNNGIFKVVSATTSDLVLSGKQVVTEAAGASVTIKHHLERDTGSQLRSFTIEVEPTGTAGLFQTYTGCVFSSMSLDIPAQGVITGAFEVAAQTPVAGSVTAGTGAIVAADVNSVMNTETNFLALYMGGPENGTRNIVSATDATPVVVTTAAAHSIHTGDLVMIAGCTQAGLNTTWIATRVSSTTFSLDGSTTATMAAAATDGNIRLLKVAVPMVSGSFTISNATRDRTQAGVLGPVSKGLGQLSVTGTIRMYYSSQRNFGRFISDEYTGLAFIVRDASLNHYIFEIPRVKFTAAPAIVGGNDTDMIVEVAFAATREGTDNRTFRFCK